MINSKLVEFIPDHLEKINPGDHHLDEGEQYIDPRTSLTLMIEDEPAAIFAWRTHSQGVLHVSALISKSAKKHPLTFHRCAKYLTEHAIEDRQIQRIQMSVRCGFDMGWKWAESLGFQCEGTMRKYGPQGQHYWLFARVS